MYYPKVKFIVGDRLREAKYICFIAKSISKNEFQKAGLLILPKQVKKTIFFPDLGYSKEFWTAIKNSRDKNLVDNFPEIAVNEVFSKLPINKYGNNNESDWRKVEKKFFKLVVEFLSEEKLLSKIEKIEVLYTKYGSGGSFYPKRVGSKYHIYSTIRSDSPLNRLVRILLLNFYKIIKDETAATGSEKWFLRQSATDFLLRHTAFKKLITNGSDFILPKYYKESKQYLLKLGFPIRRFEPDLQNGNYTTQQKRLLFKFTKHQNKLLTFDSIANTLWGKNADEKYSLQAMAKVIENIRKKIKEQGINREVIITKRGQGYIFVN